VDQSAVEIHKIDGLLADFVEKHDIDFIVRGIRSFSDLDSEITYGIINRRLCGKETVLLTASSNRIHISSSMIRELASFQRKIDNFVPKSIEDEVYPKLFEFYKNQRK